MLRHLDAIGYQGWVGCEYHPLGDTQAVISEERVVESVLNRRASRLGAARIRQELQAKGLGAEAVQQAVARLQDTELERAREVWRRKFGEPAADPQTRAKHMRFLLARGFSGDVVRRAVQGTEDGDED